jgi:F0F1-type ATP synthase gamma subunit
MGLGAPLLPLTDPGESPQDKANAKKEAAEVAALRVVREQMENKMTEALLELKVAAEAARVAAVEAARAGKAEIAALKAQLAEARQGFVQRSSHHIDFD